MDENRMERGLENLIRINGEAGRGVYEKLKAISPRMARALAEYPFNYIYDDSYLDPRMRETAILGAICTLGFAVPQLKSHINAALNAGLKKDEVLEIFITMSVYAGYPAALNAIYAASEVFEERGLIQV